MKICLTVLLISFASSVLLGLLIIPFLRKIKAGQEILSYVKEHKAKCGTPTMSGICFILPTVFIPLFFVGRSEFRIVGFLDDYIKVKLRRNEGLKPYQKIFFQLAVALIVSVYLLMTERTGLYIPFYDSILDVKFFIIPLSVFVFVATTNCVNLTDGLDGLAGGVTFVYLIGIATVILFQGSFNVNGFVIVAASLAGAVLGFLLFNTHKASAFMGDTGSLALGGFIASISMFSNNILYIPIIGIMFVVSGVSVILQVLHYKRTKRRIFMMAPLHHHFQMKGYSEAKIAFVYELITFIASALCVLAIM